MENIVAQLFKQTCKPANLIVSVRNVRRRTPFPPADHRTFEDRNYKILHRYDDQNLKLTEQIKDKPNQWKLLKQPKEPTVKKVERKLLPLKSQQPQYHPYTKEGIDRIEDRGTFYDPLFNPRLHEERNRVNPDEEPFNAIYADSNAEEADNFTKARNITSPELWNFVEKLARIKVPPLPRRRKLGEQITSMPSGFVPPPEVMPDLPYAVLRTRNHLLPVYYFLNDDPEHCSTLVKMVTGDMWQLERELREHLEKLKSSNKRILTAVHEPDGRIYFRGKHLKEIVDWLHNKGF